MLNRIKGLFCQEVPVALPVAKVLRECCNCGKEHCREQWDELNGIAGKPTCSDRCDEELFQWLEEKEAEAKADRDFMDEWHAKEMAKEEQEEEREEIRMEREEWAEAYKDCLYPTEEEVQAALKLELPRIDASWSYTLTVKCEKVMALVGR